MYGRSQSFNYGNFTPISTTPIKKRKSVLFFDDVPPLLRKSVPSFVRSSSFKTVIFSEDDEKLEISTNKKSTASATTNSTTTSSQKYSQKFIKIGKFFWENLKIKKFSALIILAFYTFLGGYIIYNIESPIENEFLLGRNRFLNNLKEKLAQELWNAKLQWVDDSSKQLWYILYTICLLYSI